MSFPPSDSARLGARAYGFSICVLLPFAGIALLSAGLMALLSFTVLPLLDVLDSRGWPSRQAAVEAVVLRPSGTRLHRFDTIEILYRYVEEGRVIQGRRYDPHHGLTLRSIGNEAVAALRAQPSVTVWVNPADPGDARVRRSPCWPVVLLGLPAVLLSYVGGLMVFGGMVAWNGGWSRRLP